MDELFRTMFTEKVLLYMLDMKNTEVHEVYNESDRKIYLPPKELTAKVVVSREQQPDAVQAVWQFATITVPNRQLRENKIPYYSTDDLDRLQKCLIKYRELFFLVKKVVPRTHVGDTFLFYEFRGTTENKDNTQYFLPGGMKLWG